MPSTKRKTDYTVRTIFSADDRLTKSLRTIVGRGVRTIRGLATASKAAAIGVAGVGAAGGAAAYGVYKLTRSYSESIDALDEQATAIGMSAQALREWQGVAELNGVGADAMTSALSRMNIAVSGVHNGTGKLNKMLKEHLPLVYKQVKGAKTNEEAQAILFRAVRAVADETDQAALAAAIFGREAGPRLLNVIKKTDDELAAMRGEVTKLRGPLSKDAVQAASDFEDQLSKTKWAAEGLRDAIGSELVKAAMPALKELTAWLTDNRGEVAKEIAGSIKEIASELARVDWRGIGSTMLEAVKEAAKVMRGMLDIAENAGYYVKNPGRILPDASYALDRLFVGPKPDTFPRLMPAVGVVPEYQQGFTLGPGTGVSTSPLPQASGPGISGIGRSLVRGALDTVSRSEVTVKVIGPAEIVSTKTSGPTRLKAEDHSTGTRGVGR